MSDPPDFFEIFAGPSRERRQPVQQNAQHVIFVGDHHNWKGWGGGSSSADWANKNGKRLNTFKSPFYLTVRLFIPYHTNRSNVSSDVFGFQNEENEKSKRKKSGRRRGGGYIIVVVVVFVVVIHTRGTRVERENRE